MGSETRKDCLADLQRFQITERESKMTHNHSDSIKYEKAIIDAARKLLRNYYKDSQYPENIHMHVRELKDLRDAVIAYDSAEKEFKNDQT